MRILALDIGKVRCGIAVSDPAGRVASPVCVLPAEEIQKNDPSWQRVLDDWQPELLVVGLPFSLSGEQGKQAKRIRGIGDAIAQACGLPIEYADERLSSAEAKRSLSELGVSEKDKRGKVDMIAASLFLQAWLDNNFEGESSAWQETPNEGGT